MLRNLKRIKKNQEGATAIEFAVVAPVLFMLIFGIIEFGILFTTQSALEGATSSAARTYKAQARTGNAGAQTNAIHSLIAQYGRGVVKPAKLRVVAARLNSWGSGSMPNDVNSSSGRAGSTGQIIQYRVYYDYDVLTPFLSRVIGDNRGIVALRASTVVQNEPSIGGGGGA